MTSDYSQKTALVLGAGSIGRRHLRNLATLGVGTRYAFDPELERLDWVKRELGVDGFADLDEALAATRPDYVLVCSPPVYHVAQAVSGIHAGAHVFIEKPISNRLEEIDALGRAAADAGRTVAVGYNIRFHKGPARIKELVGQGAIGRPLWARFDVGQYLPDWRPWQDYRANYTARRSLGGGIILDSSHEIDQALWQLGRPDTAVCLAGKVSDLEMDVEDCATILLRSGRAQADVHLDCVQRIYARTHKVVGELGTIEWDYTKAEVRLWTTENGQWDTWSYETDPNDMYLAEMTAFLERCALGAGAPETPLADIESATATLRVALAAKRSAEQNTVEKLEW